MVTPSVSIFWLLKICTKNMNVLMLRTCGSGSRSRNNTKTVALHFAITDIRGVCRLRMQAICLRDGPRVTRFDVSAVSHHEYVRHQIDVCGVKSSGHLQHNAVPWSSGFNRHILLLAFNTRSTELIGFFHLRLPSPPPIFLQHCILFACLCIFLIVVTRNLTVPQQFLLPQFSVLCPLTLRQQPLDGGRRRPP